MNKRQLKKFLFKGNCPKCMTNSKVTFLRLRGHSLEYFMKGHWVVINCECGYKETR